jgi:cytochrome c biogenesis protein CcdA
MLLFILAYLGGVLTIASPCILPVLPFVFARADQPFLRSGLPMLVGMGGTFAVVASLAAVGGGWLVAANEYGRLAARSHIRNQVSRSGRAGLRLYLRLK